MVDVIVTSAGGIEEDFMKCMAKTYMGAAAVFVHLLYLF